MLSTGLSAQEASFRYEYSPPRLSFYLQNNVDCPLHIRVVPKDSVAETWSYRAEHILPPRARLDDLIVAPAPADTTDAISRALTHFSLDVRLGDPDDTAYDQKHRYLPPFAPGRSYELIQGFDGSVSHYTPEARYALDFDMPVGDTVCAARAGVVVKIRDQFTEGGWDEKYRWQDNHIIIYQDDGTLAAYVHLDHQGALVDYGDRVTAGQPIGISGFTGYATIPHLHFVVRRNTREGQVSIPIRFRKAGKLKVGRKIKRRK